MKTLDKAWVKYYKDKIHAYAFKSNSNRILRITEKMANDLLTADPQYIRAYLPNFGKEEDNLIIELRNQFLIKHNLPIMKKERKMTHTLNLNIFENWYSSLHEDIQRDIKDILADIASGEDIDDAINGFKDESCYKSPEHIAKIELYITSFINHLKKLKEV